MNRTLFFTLSLSLGVAALASCVKSDEFTAPEESTGQYVTFEVSTPDVTRVGIDGVDVYWTEGDQMLFYCDSSIPGTATTFSKLDLSDLDEEGDVAKFSGELSSTLSGGFVSGFYPASNVYTNTGTNAAMYLSTLRIIQPAYFQYTYTDGNIDPASIGQFCYMHVLANELMAADASVLTGTVKHLMSFVDINLANPKGAVEKVVIAMDAGLTYPSMKVSSSGTVTKDQYVDYIISADGSETYQVEMDYLLVDLTNSTTGELGVSANSDGIIPVRIPLIPQVLTDSWKVFVRYADGTEDVAAITFSGASLSAGRVYNADSTLDLSSATSLTTPAPKIGDYYYADGTWSTTYDSTKSLEGMVYQLTGTGVDTKVAKIFATYYQKNKFVHEDIYGTATIDSGICNSTLTSNESGLLDASILAVVCRTHSKASSVGVSSTSTILEVCKAMLPSHYAALALNGDIKDMTFSGDETGYWYLPSMAESYRFALNGAKLQGHKVIYINEQMKKLPDSITGTYSSAETTVDSVNGFYFNIPIPSSGSYQYRSSGAAANGGNLYLRQRNFYTLDPTGTSYFSQQTYGNVTGAQPGRPIKRVN
ncbi:MAG: hypothetical protein SNG45_01985 [Rikenellaceae bacterium]